MQELAQSPLAAWESFYIIVGSSAGALTGLQFVVVTLVMESICVQYSLISLFAIAGATLLLVYIGIHNAWDTTTYVAAQAKKPTEGDETAPTSEPRTTATAPSATAGS